MQGKERTFTPEVEKVWNKDYQCEYYRGVIIDGEDNIVERCTRTHASYDAALDEAKKILESTYRTLDKLKENGHFTTTLWNIYTIMPISDNKKHL